MTEPRMMTESDGLYRQFEAHFEMCRICHNKLEGFCPEGRRLFDAWNDKQDQEEAPSHLDD